MFSDTKESMFADNAVIKAFGGKPFNLKEYRESFVIPANEMYLQRGCRKEELLKNPEKVAKIFSEAYEPKANSCSTRKNAKKLLNFLKKKNISSIILSNHPTDKILNQLKRLGIAGFFKAVLGNESQENSVKERNKQERLDKYLKRKTKKPGQIAIIGDSPEEIEIGKNLGLKTIAITGGYCSAERLRKSNPDFLIRGLIEVINKVKNNSI